MRWVLGEPGAALSWRGILGYAGLAIAGTILGLLRLVPGSVSVLWAEDSSIFAAAAYRGSWFDTVLQPYAGYAHVFPRTVAEITVHVVDLAHVPAAFAVAACTAASLASTVVMCRLRGRIPSMWIRLAIWAAIVLLPIAGPEVNGSIANSHWYLLIALFGVLATANRGVAGTTVTVVVILAAVMSDPLSILFAPLAAMHLGERFRAARSIVPIVFVVATAIQLWVVVGTSIASPSSRPTVISALRTLSYRVLLQPELGSSGAQTAYQGIGSAAVVLGTICYAGVVVLAFRTRVAGLVASATIGAVLIFSASALIRWVPQLDPVGGSFLAASRYSVVPGALILVALGATASTVLTRRRVVRSIAVVGFGAMLLSNTASVVQAWGSTGRAEPVAWSMQVADAEARCREHPRSTATLTADPPGFDLEMACAAVLDSATLP